MENNKNIKIEHKDNTYTFGKAFGAVMGTGCGIIALVAIIMVILLIFATLGSLFVIIFVALLFA